jgi:N-acetylglucosaminyldiphosphoundecaprenol N-acetyl-beta-D-mannosaminyltransferase
MVRAGEGYLPPLDRQREIQALEQRLTGTGKTTRDAHRQLRLMRYRAIVAWARGAKRAFDAISAAVLLAALAPLLALLLVLCRGRIRRQPKLGRWAEPFDLLAFDSPGLGWLKILSPLACLVNILKGELSWVGPRPLDLVEATAEDRLLWRRWDMRPGVLSLWWIRRRANNHFGTEWEADVEYARSQSLAGDAGIAVRALPALLYGGGADVTDDLVSVLGILVDNMTMSDTLAWIDQRIAAGDAAQIRFLNADCVNRAWRETGYREVLNGAGLTLADGIGLKLAGQILSRPIRQNVNGTDLFPRLCEMLAAGRRSLFLLGARPGIAEAAADWVREHHPGVQVAGVRDGYFSLVDDEQVVRQIAASRADVLLVAFGAPRQDMWISERLPRLNVRVAAGVGGLFDFYSGRIPRAPQWMRDMAIEWLYRFYQEPRRMWRRYFVGNFVFLARVVRERLGQRPWEKG